MPKPMDECVDGLVSEPPIELLATAIQRTVDGSVPPDQVIWHWMEKLEEPQEPCVMTGPAAALTVLLWRSRRPKELLRRLRWLTPYSC